MQISEIMVRRVTAVEMDTSLRLVRGVFEDFGLHHLPVVDRKKLVGMIFERDLLKAISPYVGTPSETDRDRETLKKRAHQIMVRDPLMVRPETDIEAAARALIDVGASALPVVNRSRKLVGIVTWKDLLRFCLENPGSSFLA